MDNHFLLEEYNAKQAFLPVDLNTAAVSGARISLAKHLRVAVVLNLGTSTAALLQVTLKQHNAASAGTTKDLVVANPYFYKAGAATTFTKVEPSSAVALYDLSSVFAADSGLLVFEVLAEDLDVQGGFSFFSVEVADSTAAKLGSGVYIARDSRFEPGYAGAI